MKTAIKHLKIKKSQIQAVTSLNSETIFNHQRKQEIKELDKAIDYLEKYSEQ